MGRRKARSQISEHFRRPFDWGKYICPGYIGPRDGFDLRLFEVGLDGPSSATQELCVNFRAAGRLPAGSKRPDRGLAIEILWGEQGQHFTRDNRASGVLSGSILLAHLAVGPTAILNILQP